MVKKCQDKIQTQEVLWEEYYGLNYTLGEKKSSFFHIKKIVVRKHTIILGYYICRLVS